MKRTSVMMIVFAVTLGLSGMAMAGGGPGGDRGPHKVQKGGGPDKGAVEKGKKGKGHHPGKPGKPGKGDEAQGPGEGPEMTPIQYEMASDWNAVVHSMKEAHERAMVGQPQGQPQGPGEGQQPPAGPGAEQGRPGNPQGPGEGQQPPAGPGAEQGTPGNPQGNVPASGNQPGPGSKHPKHTRHHNQPPAPQGH